MPGSSNQWDSPREKEGPTKAATQRLIIQRGCVTKHARHFSALVIVYLYACTQRQFWDGPHQSKLRQEEEKQTRSK